MRKIIYHFLAIEVSCFKVVHLTRTVMVFFPDRSIIMSSESNFIPSLISAQTNLYKFGGPILMSLGAASCILSSIVFTIKNLRKNPCSINLIAFNIFNLLRIYTSLLLSTLQNGYNIDPSLYSLDVCRFRFYTMLLFDILSPSYLILTSVDRILITSPNTPTRERSTRRLAYICIITITLFWLLSQSHALVFTNILQPAPYCLKMIILSHSTCEDSLAHSQLIKEKNKKRFESFIIYKEESDETMEN
jgi:hypothetical protein